MHMMASCGNLCSLVVLFIATRAYSEYASFCYQGMPCYFTPEEGMLFDQSLEGHVLSPLSPLYANITVMKNLRVIRFPAYIIIVKSVKDVQKCVLFARKHDLKVTVQSSGHDYIGRSTGDGSAQINLSHMKSISVDLNSPLHPDGVVRVDSGNTWARVYQEVDKYNRIIVGGSAHSVAMGGYTLGGGHSPMSRTLGLAVDNLLAVTMVTADGSIVNASADSTVSIRPDGTLTTYDSADLFWALRGGGGGTFGIVTSFLFKLHRPPSGFARLACTFKFRYGHDEAKAKDLVKFYFNLAKSLPTQWGGYFLSGFDTSVPTYDTFYYTVFMLHYGPSSQQSYRAIHPLIDYHPERQTSRCNTRDFRTFWEYEIGTYDPLYIRITLVNALMRPSDYTDHMAGVIRDIVMVPPTNTSLAGCTNVLIGGKVSTVGHFATSVSPNLRAALSSLSCGVGWKNSLQDHENMAAVARLETKLLRFSHGVYLNEPPAIIPHWKQNLWGANYPRLLRIKKVWDFTNFFSCLYCVGYDLGRNYTNMATGSILIG